MRRPSPAILVSIALHAGVAALAFVSWPRTEPKPLPSSVPVSIVSESIVEAAAADNPQPESSPDTAATAPAPPEPMPPEPVPPTPPRPTPPPTPRPTPTPTRPTPPRPTPPQPTPPRPTPPRPAPPRPAPTPPRPQPTLDLDALAGPRNPGTNQGRPAAGQQGRGTAPRAIGRASLQALGAQVRPSLNCDLPGADSTLVRVVVRLGLNGRIVGSPRLQGARNPIADSVLRAIQAAQPFDLPAGYEEQDIPFVFNTETWC